MNLREVTVSGWSCKTRDVGCISDVNKRGIRITLLRPNVGRFKSSKPVGRSSPTKHSELQKWLKTFVAHSILRSTGEKARVVLEGSNLTDPQALLSSPPTTGPKWARKDQARKDDWEEWVAGWEG